MCIPERTATLRQKIFPKGAENALQVVYCLIHYTSCYKHLLRWSGGRRDRDASGGSRERNRERGNERDMNENFARVLSLLRQEKGVSQRKAAGELGISQALLSHYENGVREPGLAFVTRACDYYHVSADYLLGRTLTRDGAVIEAEELLDASEGRESLKGSIMAKLQKKLLVNAVSLYFDLLGRTGSREAVGEAGAYLSGAIYQLYRLFYRQAGGNDSYFSLDREAFDLDQVSAEMTRSRVRYAKALGDKELREKFPAVDAETLAQEFPGLSQSVAQVLHSVDERVAKGE